MAVNLIGNQFHFIGECYSDAVRKKSNKGAYTYVILCVKSQMLKGIQYIPVSFHGELAETAYVLCRAGDIVAIDGQVLTNCFVDRETGDMSIRVHFIGMSVMRLVKTRRIKIGKTKFTDLMGLIALDNTEPLKKKK